MHYKYVQYTLLASLCACSELPAIEAERCGNGVVEASNREECDTHVDDGLACRPATTTGACRFDCTTTACPDGFGCGMDGLCRQSTARFTTLSRTGTAVSTVRLADMDADGRDDVVARTALGASVTYSNEPYNTLESRTIAIDSGWFVTGQFQGPRRNVGSRTARAPHSLAVLNTDLRATGSTQGAAVGTLNMFRGSTLRTLRPTLYPAIPVAADGVRLASGRMSQTIGQSGAGRDLLVFADISARADSRGQRGQHYSLGHFAPADDGTTFNYPLVPMNELDSLAGSDAAGNRFGAPIATGKLVDGVLLPIGPDGALAPVPYPCDTVAWTTLGAAEGADRGAGWVYPLCRVDLSKLAGVPQAQLPAALAGAYVPNYLDAGSDLTQVPRVKLTPPEGAIITGGVTLRDVPRYVPRDGGGYDVLPADGALDVLIPSQDGLLIAYGDKFWSINQPRPTDAAQLQELTLERYPGVKGPKPPLAFGDFNGDGLLDWVDADAVRFNASANPLLANLSHALPRTAKVARAYDMNQDGVDDLALGGEGGLTILQGRGKGTVYPNMNTQSIPRAGVVTDITIGDFDADNRLDVGFTERSTGSDGATTRDSLAVCFGTDAFPGEPSDLGSVARINQLTTTRLSWILSGKPDAIDSLVAVGSTDAGSAAITIQGRVDRQLNAHFGLSTPTAPLRRGIALAAESGWFQGTQQGLISLAASVEVTREQGLIGETTLRAWFVPTRDDADIDNGSVQSSVPMLTMPSKSSAQGTCDEACTAQQQQQAAALAEATQQYAAAAIAAFDVDGDGTDEALIAIPSYGDRAGSLWLARPSSDQANHSSLALTQLPIGALFRDFDAKGGGTVRARVGDFDGDGHLDVLVLFGKAGEVHQGLLFFHDGAGSLDLNAPLSFGAALGLRDVAVLQGARQSLLLGLDGAEVAQLVVERSTGGVRRGEVAYSHGLGAVSAIATGDVNGDGVTDLVIGGNSGLVVARGIPVLE